MQGLLCLHFVIREHPILQISDDKIPPSQRGIKAKDLLGQSLDTQAGNVLDGDLSSELKLCGCPRLVSESA